jgi:FKBP-type peptidyl-prolyl cis-trans isomerase
MTTYKSEVDITGDGGIIKKMINEGEGETPTKG